MQSLMVDSADDFEPSMVWDQNLSPSVDVQIRSSRTAHVPSIDPIAKCLRSRIGSLLGNLQHIDTDQIQIVRYDPNEQIRLHCDWFSKKLPETTDSDPTPHRAYNRLSTLFAYLQDDCSGGETYFPELPSVSANADTDKFSRSDTGTGLLVKPKKGNAVFWMNMHMNGTGDRRVLHAGLPVHSGRKIGLNIFSRYYSDSPIIGS
jgi:prolyl 4-hydroxylase